MVTLREVSEGEGNPETIGFVLLDQEGEFLGSLLVTPRSSTLFVQDIVTEEGPGSLGPQAVRDILRQLRARFPRITHIEGIRTTGVRGKQAPSGVLRPGEAQLIRRSIL